MGVDAFAAKDKNIVGPILLLEANELMAKRERGDKRRGEERRGWSFIERWPLATTQSIGRGRNGEKEVVLKRYSCPLCLGKGHNPLLMSFALPLV